MLIIDDITYRIAGRTLLEHASVTIPEGAKVGFVGRNGAGKTTLFGLIAGDISPESGSITLPPRFKMGRVAQEAPATDDNLIDYVLRADTERLALLKEAETALDPNRIAEIQIRLADMGAHAAESRAATILAGLGFDEAAQLRPCRDFSGGWRMRVALAAVLFAEPDLLLLDEPTNYLDLEGTLWLEAYVAKYPHTVLLISHDRDLLDEAVDSIIHLENRKISFWRGNYTSFARQRREKLILLGKAKEKQDARRKHLQSFVDRFRAKATKATQAQSRLKMLEKMEVIEDIVEEHSAPIRIPNPKAKLAPPILVFDKVTIGYDRAKPVLSQITLRIDDDDRIALLGQNGNGKSTLAKLIVNKLEPFAGDVTKASKLSIAYFAQHQMDELFPAESAVDHVRRRMVDAPEARVRSRVAEMGLETAKMDTPVQDLSGGERARLLLGLATFDGPNLLVLDEPTNHLDIDARESLIHALNDYEGAVILVSHDRHLIEATMDRLWLVAGGKVTPFDGDMDEYRKLVISGPPKDNTKSASEADKITAADRRRLNAEKRASLAPLKKKITGAEKQMDDARKKIASLDAELAKPDLFTKDATKGTKLMKDRAALAAHLDQLEEQWLEWQGEYEETMAATEG